MAVNSARISKKRICAYALGCVLLVICFLFITVFLLPGETLLGLITPSLEAYGVSLDAENARTIFPLGVRFENVVFSNRGERPISLDEASVSWEWTALFRRLPSHIRVVQGNAVADIRLSPVIWNPSRGEAMLSDISSDAPGLPALSGGGVKFFLRRAQARWSGSGDNLTAFGSMEFDYLTLPVNAANVPITEARIDKASLSFVIRGNTLYIHNLKGSYEGARVEGGGEIARFLSDSTAVAALQLTISNPFEGRVGMLFDMMAKNAKSVTLRITGPPAAPRTEILLF